MAFDPPLLQRCWFLAGPTASGKTAVSLELAEQLDAEIVALDSMTLYRGMDIGTAKPSPNERARVPHHLLDLVDPHEEFSLADYLMAAEAVCRDIVTRGRTPLFVGGTGLYLRGVLRGIFEGPAANPEIRERWQQFARENGAAALHARLGEIDPIAAARLPPADERRIIRALEVFEVTGQPLSAQHQQTPLPPDQRPAHVYWIAPDRAWLHERINRRVEAMFAEGLVEEVRMLKERPLPLSRSAAQALGYKETLEYLAGEHSLSETVTLIQTRTRQFAKRQHTWFRNLEECQPLPIAGTELVSEIVARLLP